MKQIISVYKPKGLTPYQLIQRLKTKHPEYQNVPIGFAGRLDPLAHGVLLLMIGEETKNRNNYLSLPKGYTFAAVLGLSTDTYDVLGLCQNNLIMENYHNNTQQLKKSIHDFIKIKTGKQLQSYPPFSSKTVAGKPLYWWARKNRLGEITIPQRQIEINDYKLLATEEVSAGVLQKNIKQQIKSVQGDFRQEEIEKRWNKFFRGNKNETFITVRFEIQCSSGTYVRGLVHELGNYLGTGAVTLEILRTRVGDFELDKILDRRGTE